MRQLIEEDRRQVGLDDGGQGMLITHVPTYVFQQIDDCNTLKEMWDELCLVWEGDDETREAGTIPEKRV